MIRPHKYLDLNNCVINISTEILKILIEIKLIKYDELFQRLYSKKGESIKELFIPSLDFLFLLGKIEYSSINDCLELII